MKKLLSKFDLFPSLPTLRAEGESEVVNLCGSLFSILVFGSFVYVFVSSIISTINFQTIDSKQILTMNRPADEPISNITVGVGIQFANLVSLRSIFQLRAFIADRSLHFTPIDVFPCRREMWAAFDDTKYHTLNLDAHMCIQSDNIAIYGEFGTPKVQFIMFNLSLCSNATSPVPCASPAFISWFFANRMFWGRFIPASLIILDTGISATNEDALTFNPYEKTQFLLFNLHQQLFVQTFVGTYEINTDLSFLPFEQMSQQKGHFVTQCTITTIVNYLNTPALIDFYIFPSPVHRIITRSYGKFDSVLSYVGGLYGIVISFLAFFLMSFNQYKYELRVSQGAFTYKDSHLAREQDLHFLKYLKYVIYDWAKTLFCCEINWRDCKAINEAREEAIEQIDVRHLLKRISHLEKVINTFVNPHGEISMYMAESSSLEEVKRRRNIVEYCHKFTTDQRSPTITNFENLDAMVVYSLGSLVKTESSLVYPNSEQQKQQEQQQKAYELMEMDKNEQEPPKSSLQLIQFYTKRYAKRYDINEKSFELTQEDHKAEQQLAESFYNLDEQSRMKIVKKIPLGILYRLHCCRNSQNDNANRKDSTGMQNSLNITTDIKEEEPYMTTVLFDGEGKKQSRRKRNRKKMDLKDEKMDNVFDLNY